MDKINVAYFEPGKNPTMKEIVNSLESFQEIVGGYIEPIKFSFDLKLYVICNEEGKLDNLLPNFKIGNDIIRGNFFVVRKLKNGDYGSLTLKDIYVLNRNLKIRIENI